MKLSEILDHNLYLHQKETNQLILYQIHTDCTGHREKRTWLTVTEFKGEHNLDLGLTMITSLLLISTSLISRAYVKIEHHMKH